MNEITSLLQSIGKSLSHENAVIHSLQKGFHILPTWGVYVLISLIIYGLFFELKALKAIHFILKPISKHLTILDRYLITQFMGPFCLSIVGFTLIAMIDILFFLVEEVIVAGVSPLTIIRLLLYKLPEIMVLFLPMAVLFSIMLLLVRMAKDNELTVLRTSGIHTFRIALPLLILTASTSTLSYLNNEKLVPWTQRNAEQLIQEQIQKIPPPSIVEDIVFKGTDDRFFYIKKVDIKKGKMENILIFEPKSEFPRTITAKYALWKKNQWSLLDGSIQDVDAEGNIQFMDKFSELTLHVNQEIQTFYEKQKTTSEMDIKELKSKISKLEKGGVSTRALRVEYYTKTSIPLACFVFGIMGIAACLSLVRSGKDWWGVIVAIIIAVLSAGFYFFIMAVCKALAKDGTLTPLIGAWLPNMIYGGVALSVITYQCKYK